MSVHMSHPAGCINCNLYSFGLIQTTIDKTGIEIGKGIGMAEGTIGIDDHKMTDVQDHIKASLQVPVLTEERHHLQGLLLVHRLRRDPCPHHHHLQGRHQIVPLWPPQ